MKKTFLMIALLSALTITAAQAKEKPYGVAGCGWGSQLFDKNSSQVLAATTNASSYTQFFGISSGTSNCTDDGTVDSAKATPMFIEANRSALANDVARGNGEAVATLSHMMGCEDSVVFASALQKNYQQIFSNQDVSSNEISGRIVHVVKQGNLVCHNVI